MRNIKYIGAKPTEDAFFDRTQIIWTPGKVDTVLDDALATEMLRFAEFEDAGDSQAVVNGITLDTITNEVKVGNSPLDAGQKAAFRAGMGVPESLSNRAFLTAKDTVSGSGVLNGQATDSGAIWQCSGAGFDTTAIVGDHIEGTLNTYCNIDTGEKVFRAVQYFSGDMCTIAVGLNSGLTDMLHQNFDSLGSPALSYWKTGVGSGVAPQWGYTVQTVPNLNDGVPHKCVLEISGCFALGFVDDVLVSIGYDENFPSIQGNWFFAQIHGPGDKVYGVESYSSIEIEPTKKSTADFSVVRADASYSYTMTVGDPLGTGYQPESPSYFWTNHSSGHVFGSNGEAKVTARARTTGYPAVFKAICAIGIVTELKSKNDGVGEIAHNGNARVQFPMSPARVDLPVPLKLPTYTVTTLPTAANFSQSLIYVSDGAGNKRLAVCDGTNWRWPDGVIVS